MILSQNPVSFLSYLGIFCRFLLNIGMDDPFPKIGFILVWSWNNLAINWWCLSKNRFQKRPSQSHPLFDEVKPNLHIWWMPITWKKLLKIPINWIHPTWLFSSGHGILCIWREWDFELLVRRSLRMQWLSGFVLNVNKNHKQLQMQII